MLTRRSACQAGFSLVEMMIAVVLGMILVGATIALVVSTGQANAETVQTARITQEMRAISEIVSRDLRRARYVDDAIATIGTGGGVPNPYDAIVVSNGGACIQYAYENFWDNDTPADDSDDVPRHFRTIWREVVDGVGVVYLAENGAASPTCGSDTGVLLSSPQVNVTSIVFVANDPCVPTAVEVTVQGQLTADPDIQRSFSESIRLRNAALPSFTCTP